MKNNTKIFIGFLTIIILIFSQVIITYKLQSDILKDTQQTKNVEAPLRILAQETKSYDSETTKTIYSALLSAQKGDNQSVKEYKTFYDKLISEINYRIEKKTAVVLLGQSQRSQALKNEILVYLKNITATNINATSIESIAWEAIEKGDTDTAYSLIIGGDYKKYKTEIFENVQGWISIEDGLALDSQKDILKESQQIIYLNLIISTIIFIMIIVTLLIIRSFVAEKSNRKGKRR
jgi:hypothetical protein